MKNPTDGSVEAKVLSPGWKAGPLPPGTYWWGGVVPVGWNPSGFQFADFCGDHIKIWEDMAADKYTRIEAADVAFYNNSLQLPYGYS